MEINLNEDIRKFITLFILIIIPLILLGVGAIFDIKSAGYFLLGIFWFGLGIIFYGALVTYKK